jgi:sugar-specific transcriptional regulator TrmB
VGRISKNTQLHPQDIYKLLPKLEKMGLITKTIDKPFMIEAIPFKKALENVILKEREKANQKITFLEGNLKEMVDALQNQPELKEEARFTLLSTDEAIKNKGKFIFKKPRKQFLLVASPEIIAKPGLHYYSDLFQYIAENKAKLRIVLISTSKEAIKQVVEKLTSKNAIGHVKHLHKTVSKNFQIIDNKEAWVATQQKTEQGYPCILWTNDSNVVDVYREYFKKVWNDPKATTVYRNEAKNHIDQLSVETFKPTQLLPNI